MGMGMGIVCVCVCIEKVWPECVCVLGPAQEIIYGSRKPFLKFRLYCLNCAQKPELKTPAFPKLKADSVPVSLLEALVQLFLG